MAICRVLSGGNTPACAGKKLQFKMAALHQGKHPRVCGEESSFADLYASPMETPPRVRGRTASGRITTGTARNTPACAGKNVLRVDCVFDERRHPRVCGEEHETWRLPLLPEETPPRVRGRRHREARLSARRRNTPACAGKKRALKKGSDDEKKHPRVCGEEFRDSARAAWRYGNTPACAGKNFGTEEEIVEYEKHPRVCGEEFSPPLLLPPESETPPRVRGRSSGGLFESAGDGNTPACAGKNFRLNILSSRRKKHPRVCGEEDHDIHFPVPFQETPPRVRGRTPYADQVKSRLGNTPACAGKKNHVARVNALP